LESKLKSTIDQDNPGGRKLAQIKALKEKSQTGGGPEVRTVYEQKDEEAIKVQACQWRGYHYGKKASLVLFYTPPQ
jgi:hypothetical protein